MGLEIEFTKRGIELDNLRLPVLLRLLYGAFAAGGCLGFYGGILASTEFLCQDQPEKRRRTRQFGIAATTLAALSAAGILFLTAPSRAALKR
mmetsp:Transcript_12592/g.32228  ORF Transcript_12592/g.32228 Transcript_12592/m.32228 type:complete len:92 (+) Transcript_12592:67-342(+)